MPFAVRTRADDADKHLSDVNTLVYHKDRLYSGADDGKIKVWEEDLKLAGTIDAHSSSVFSLAVGQDTLYSCSNDGTVKAWSISDLKEKSTIVKGENEIWKLWFADGTLYAGDNEGVVRLIIDDKFTSSVNLIEPVKDMVVVGNLVYAVRDLDLVITEIHPGTKASCSTRKTIMGRAPVCIAGDKICFASRSGKDIIVHENSSDLHFKEVAQARDAHEMIINSMCGVTNDGDTLIYSGGWDKVIKQWKIVGNSIQKTNACPVDMCINIIAAGPKGEIYVGGSDGHIVRIDV